MAKEHAAAFKLAEAQAMKITRRITGRVRLYARVFELVLTRSHRTHDPPRRLEIGVSMVSSIRPAHGKRRLPSHL